MNKQRLISIFITIALIGGFNGIGYADSDEIQIKKILVEYHASIQSKDLSGTKDLFSEDSIIVESGNVEGTYSDYVDHHLSPELHHFESIVFWDYDSNVNVVGKIAYALETYKYRIVLKESAKVIERKGVATTILRKSDEQWKIVHIHTSARNP